MGSLTSVFVLFTLLGLCLGISKSGLESRISGGTKALKGQFPYHVSIQTYDKESGNYCGGSILNSKWILTAATCIISPNTTLFYVMAGTTDWRNTDKTGTKYDISEVVVHPDNANNRAIDIALIKVKQIIKFSNTIRNIKLPTRDIAVTDLPVYISGWGVATSENHEPVYDLHYIRAKIFQQDACRQKYYWIKDIDLCTVSNRGSGICFKDVGSPIAFGSYFVGAPFQVGIASNRVTCGNGEIDQSIRIWGFVDWIKSVIE